LRGGGGVTCNGKPALIAVIHSLIMRIVRSNRTGDHVMERLFKAHNYAYVCSPYISKNYAQDLAHLAKKGTLVKVLTSDKVIDLGFHIRTFFKEIKRSDNLDSLKTLVISRNDLLEHSKLYIIDDEYAVMGSADLTTPGMYENGETVNIFEERDEVIQTREAFEAAWNKALATVFDSPRPYVTYGTRQHDRSRSYQRSYPPQRTRSKQPDSVFDVVAKELGKWLGGLGL